MCVSMFGLGMLQQRADIQTWAIGCHNSVNAKSPGAMRATDGGDNCDKLCLSS